MVGGSCLCGGVRFEIERAVGPFELCHCSRCRKVSGSAYLTWLSVRREDFRFVQGADLIKTYECPVNELPPPYDTSFCSRCGSQVPNPTRTGEPQFEIPAGALDDDPLIKPDKHIYVECSAPWDHIADDLPQMTKKDIQASRKLTCSIADPTDALRATYAALNRNDIEATCRIFDAQIAWIEPAEYAAGGTYHGYEAVKSHLSEARGTWAEGSCEPERFIVAGDKVIVYIHVRVRLQHEADWREGRHAAVYTFHNDKAIEMRIFDDEQQARDWAGVTGEHS